MAVAETVEFSRPAPYGRIYFCHQVTRHLVWRDEWRQHANGTIAVTRR